MKNKQFGKVQKLREEIEKVNSEIERAERNYELNKAAELKYRKTTRTSKKSTRRRKNIRKAKRKWIT